MSHMIFFFPL